MAWDLEESALAEFWEVTRSFEPWERYSMKSSVELTEASSRPMMFMLFLLSSLSLSSVRLFSKS